MVKIFNQPDPMSRKLTDKEIALFRSAMDDVKPLQHDEKIQHHKEAINIKLRPREKTLKNKPHHFKDNEYLETCRPESYLFYQDPSINHKIIRKLRQGQYNSEAKLDLHGCTVQQAAQLVSNFLDDCCEKQKRYALIIHGKGKNARIKTQLASWLLQNPYVLAYCSAQPKHGGTGALYLLLKNPKKGEYLG
jgi:DNA-nicking Smr family endonuclease